MDRLRIIADDKIPYLKGVIEPYADIDYLPPFQFTPVEVKSADALIIRTRTLCNESLLEGSDVKMIATATIGYDHIDRNYCAKAGITWSNAPGCNADSVAQYIMSVVFIWSRKSGIPVKGLKIGIVGVGNVGKKVEAFARRCGMKPLLCDPPRALAEQDDTFVNIETIAQKADVITFHTPLIFDTDFATYKLANSQLFEHMKERPVLLINSARGGVVDEKEMLEFMSYSKQFDVVTDCWEDEPHINIDLLNMSMLSTPHIAGYSYDGKANATRMAVDSISSYFSLSVDTSSIVPPPVVDPVISVGLIINNLIDKNIIKPEQKEVLNEAFENVTSIDDILKNENIDLNIREYIVGEILLKTYDPRNDDQRLRNDPGSFEEQRGDYPFRRELKAYSVKI